MLGNQTRITEFILLGFGDVHGFQTLLFLTFLMIYTVTMTGNILIVALVSFDHHLRSPMYFFLGHLAFLESCYTSNLMPRMLLSLLTGNRAISVSGCFTQWYLCASFIGTECYLLCVMSFDRYLAICKPLHYATIMTTQTCIQLAAASWINGFAIFLVLLVLMLQLTFCGSNEVDHYFCDYFPLLKICCSDISVMEMMSFIAAAVITVLPFLLTLTSYVYIIVTILKIPSATGRQKAFSTCSSHLIVVSIYYGAIMFVYMLPKTEALRGLDKVLSFLYTALPPLINPFIYSLRNKEVKEAVKKILARFMGYKSN